MDRFMSYKQWKQLNESMGHLTPLGIRKPETIGELQSRWTEMGMSMPMRSKKMLPGMGGMGDDEEAPMPMKGKGKKGKKAMPPPPEDDMDMDMDMDDEEGLGDEEDLGDEEGLGDEDELGDEEDLGDEDELGDDMGDDMDDEMGDMPPMPPMPPKKKGKAFDGASMMLKGAARMVKGMKESHCPPDCDCEKCCGKGKKKPKKMKGCYASKQMTKEDSDFVASLKDQCGMSFFDINNDGTFKEDALFTPYDPNAELVDNSDESRPGEVGFAPQQRVGGELGSMAEWTKKYRRKINEAIKTKGKPTRKGRPAVKGKSRKAR